MRCVGFALALGATTGCAAIIGASFDDAGLAPVEAGGDGSTPFGDVIANEVGETIAPFDPLSLPNLGLWLDATYAVDVNDAGTGVVTRWHDRSVYGRDAVPAGGGTNAPSLVANSLNGLPVVHFTRAQLDVLATGWAGPTTNEITTFIVVRGYAISALRFQNAVGTYPFLVLPGDSTGAANWVLSVGDVVQTSVLLQVPFPTTSANVIEARWRADGTVDTYTNGTLDEQRIVTNMQLPSAVLYIGGALPLLPAPNTVVPFADGDIAEAIVYTNALADADRVEVEGYLHAKWGIAP